MASDDSIGKELESSDVLIDVPQVMEPVLWPECCIYRVPKNLRKVKKAAYTPNLVSIGPFHHGKTELRDMEMYKLIYLKDFLYRTEMIQDDLVKIIQDNEGKIRHCYSNECGLNSKKFVKMILLDAIFIIELFLKVRDNDIKEEEAKRKGKEVKEEKEAEEEKEYILSKPWLRIRIYYDFILLENQLPFFVLEKLYMFAFNFDSSSCNHHEEGKPIEEHKKDLMKQDAPFVKLSRNYFKWSDQQPETIIGEEVKHFTDLLRYLLCSIPDLPPKEPLHIRYSATKLDDAGLKFEAADQNRPLLDIKPPQNSFRCVDCSCLLACLPCLKFFPPLKRMQCILEVPPLTIDDYTEVIFRNLMALEQCHYPSHTYICNYVVLLDCLISTEQDVDLLVEKKVIVNHLGSNAAVATLINKLNDQITEVTSRYNDIAKKLNGHYDKPLNHTMATLTSVYFPDIWRGTATVVGLIVLGFTLWGFLRPFVK